MRANMLTLVDFADATFRAGRTEIERPRAVGSNRNPVRMAAMGRTLPLHLGPANGRNR
jgi:hypothetical protein